MEEHHELVRRGTLFRLSGRGGFSGRIVSRGRSQIPLFQYQLQVERDWSECVVPASLERLRLGLGPPPLDAVSNQLNGKMGEQQ